MGLSTKHVSGDHGLDWSQTLLQSGLPNPLPSARRQPPSELLNCPRCGSTNTKFCYFNNYNKTQPRHFCKACKRHWTKGGTLRNVPVGGGRKNKRPRISSSNPATTNSSTSNNPSINNVSSFSNLVGNSMSTPHHHQNQNSQFSFSSLSSFEMNNPSIISTSNQSSNGFNYIEEPTITAAAATSSSNFSDQPWQVQVPIINTGSSSSPVIDISSYWNWNDIDTFVSADLNIPWEETEIIKP